MKTNQVILSIFILGFLFSNLTSAQGEVREVSSFSSISLRISGTVFLEQGSRQSLRIEAKSSALEEIITEVKDRTLSIRFKNSNYFRNSFNPGKVNIYITVPEINGLSVSGSGNIIAGNPIETVNLDLAISGSGDISLENLKAERVKTAISGSGDIYIKGGGLADELAVAISGSGKAQMENFMAKNVEAKISGSGNCHINANTSLKAKIAGSGSIYYRGNPQLDASVAGSGRIKKL